MKEKLTKKNILIGLLIIFIGMQLVGIDRSVPMVDPNGTFEAMLGETAPDGMMTLIKDACYDCHSYQTEYPWYSSIAPVSFWLKGHVDNGRDKLNFDLWNSYSAERQKIKMENAVMSIQDKWMPLFSYTIAHPESKLDDDQRQAMIAYFEKI